MKRFSRRQFLAGTVALTAVSAGCLSGGSEPTTETALGTIAASETPTGDQPLPTLVAGDPEADVTVAGFEDYACPHCGTYVIDVFPQLAEEYLEDNIVRYEFHDYPIPVDETVSWQAANAARTVQAKRGPQAYFHYSELLFRNQSSLDPSMYASLSEEVDADGDTVRQAATERRYDETVESDRQAGVDRGVQGTPAVFVDGERVEWEEIAYEPVRNAIESARTA